MSDNVKLAELLPESYELPSQSIEEMEGDVWLATDFPSPLVQRVYDYRKLPLSELGLEQVRLLIGQTIGLAHLLPIALDVLDRHPRVCASMYDGDLVAVMGREEIGSYWADHGELAERFLRAVEANIASEANKEIQMNFLQIRKRLKP